MKSVLVRGPLINSSGYGVHSRQVFSYLENKGNCKVKTQITPWGICPFYINEDYENGLIGRIIKSSATNHTKSDISFQILFETTSKSFNNRLRKPDFDFS